MFAQGESRDASNWAAIMAYFLRRFRSTLLALAAIVSCSTSVVANGSIAEYSVRTVPAAPKGIALGPDGNIWFVEYVGDKIGKMMPDGASKEYRLPRDADPTAIVAGPDGNLWFTEGGANSKIGKITPHGTVTEYRMPAGTTAAPTAIASGPDGNLWFTTTEIFVGKAALIGKITTSGKMTLYSLPIGASGSYGKEGEGIAAGRDGNLWFTEDMSHGRDCIGKITTAGKITQYPIGSAATEPGGIAAGPDGNLWFTEYDDDKIWKITTAGKLTAVTNLHGTAAGPFGYKGAGLVGITADRSGNIWFTETFANKIGRITRDGRVTEYPVPTADARPQAIAADKSGHLWFVEVDNDEIGKLTP